MTSPMGPIYGKKSCPGCIYTFKSNRAYIWGRLNNARIADGNMYILHCGSPTNSSSATTPFSSFDSMYSSITVLLNGPLLPSKRLRRAHWAAQAPWSVGDTRKCKFRLTHHNSQLEHSAAAYKKEANSLARSISEIGIVCQKKLTSG